MATKATVTELEVLFTANTKPVDDAAKTVENCAKKIEKNPVKQTVDGDAKGAMAAMDRVEAEAKKIVSAKTVATVDANIERAETGLTKVQERLDYLHSVESTMEVTADIKRAEAALKQITRRRDALVSARESMVIDADTAPAEAALDGLADEAGAAGAEGGDAAGKGLGDGISDALKAIPVAGGVILAGVAIGKAVLDGINEGLQVEVRQDRLQALTGITEADARRFAMAAGEAYADVFGESIEQNMDTARLALQFDLLDEDATAREAEGVIDSLAGIADVLGEDVKPIAQAVTTMLRTGIAKSAGEAFDVIAAGARNGVNSAEDLLDTFIEYPALFQRLGLGADEAMGLLNQGLEAGARNSDLVADALKEFQIRATDASETSAEGYKLIGLSAEEMTKKIAAGGDGAREGLEQVLTGLRNIEDPVARNAAAVALFGTQAEDLGSALFALDLSTAVAELDGVTGAAQAMFDTLSDNDATKLEGAQRNIQVATDGIKGALAGAFSEPLGDAAEWVSANRGPLLEFFSGLVNGALDFGVAAVEGAAAATEGFGRFVSGPLADTVTGVAGVLDGLNGLPFVDLDEEVDGLKSLADGMRDFDDTTDEAADNLRAALIPGIEDARDRFNEMFDPQVDMGYLSDRTRDLASAVSEVGYAADGTNLSMSDLTARTEEGTAANALLDEQVRAAVASLDAQTSAGRLAGENQAELTARYDEGREALIRQLEQMGLTRGQAEELAAAYGAIPGKVETDVQAHIEGAQANIDDLIRRNQGKVIRLTAEVSSSGNPVYVTAAGTRLEAAGHVLAPMAAGGIPGTALDPIAQMVPPNTWRVVGDRMDVPEAYVPLDGSARSWAILREAMRRMPGAMADGGLISAASAGTALVGISIEGTLDLGGGLTGQIRGVVKSELADRDARDRWANSR